MEENEKLMVQDGSFATSFSELDQIEEVHEKAEELAGLTNKYIALAKNIFELSPDIESIKSGLANLTNEFVERLQEPDGEKAVWTTAYVNDLPDSAFLYIAPGGKKDADGKTTPRNLRKFPYKDANGSVDLPHLRNAIARIPQSNAPGLTEEKKSALQEKARKLLKKQGQKGLFEQVKEWVDERVKSLVGKKEEEPAQMRTIKAADGKTWIVLWATNAFVDREKEIFTTQSIDDFVARHKDDDVKGEFWFWHLPGSKFADIKLQARVGRFLVEAGPFDETDVGKRFKEFFEEYPYGHPTIAPEGWGASHGYMYKSQDREDGVYEWFEKKESTVLALSAASNPHNPGLSIMNKEGLVDSKQREEWEKVFGAEFVDKITSTGETKTTILEQTGVEFKGETVEEKAEETVEEPVQEEAKEETQQEETEQVVEEPEAEAKEESTVEESVVEEPEVKEEAKEEPVEAPITRQEIVDAMKAAFTQMKEELLAAVEENTTKAVDEKLEGAIEGIIEIVTPIAQKVAELSTSEESRIAAKAQETPSASLQSMFMKSIIGEETRIDGRSSLAKDGPQETDSKDANLPTVGGVPLKLWN